MITQAQGVHVSGVSPSAGDRLMEPRRAHLSIASPSQIEDTARELTAIRDGFLSTGLVAWRTPRPMILKSWQRCRDLLVDPSRRFAPLAVAWETQLRERCEANEALIRAASPVMRHLSDLLADSGYVLVLCDETGCILVLIGDVGVRRRLARIDFVPGGAWSEAAAGTNAIGTALADKHVVQLMAAEHYCVGWGDLTCTASPIRHPLTDEIVGVLDVTGDYHLIRSHLTSLLATAALEIEQELHAILVDAHVGGQLGVASTIPTASPAEPGNPVMQGGSFTSAQAWPITRERESAATLVADVQSRLNRQERRARDAELLAAAGGAISASLDLRVTLERISAQTAQLLRLDNAAVCLFDEVGEATSLHIWTGRNSTRSDMRAGLAELLGEAEAVALLRERGEPAVIDDTAASPLLPSALCARLGIGSIALLPLATARGVIGFIVAPRAVARHWAIDDVQLGLGLASLAAVAVENARLFGTLQQHNRHIEALNVVVQFLNTLPDPGQHLDVVLERIAQTLDLEAGLVFLLDPDAGHLSLAAHRGLPATVIRKIRAQPVGPPHSVSGRVATTGESLLIRDLAGDTSIVYETLRALGFRDVMAVPMAAAGAILGVLLVGSQSSRALKDEDLALVTAIGQQLGLALKNTQLLRSASDMEALREADRLKSEFLAAVSHDLRSPLTAIRASVESLLDRGAAQSAREQEHLLLNVAGQAGRLSRLVDQLLDLTRIEAGTLVLDRDWTELPALIDDAIMGSIGLDGRRPVERDLPAAPPLLFVDPDRLVQVLCNLIENACKYAPADSPITVDARWTDTQVLIGVADRGPGVSTGEHEAIFHRFYRSDRRAPARGSGLGLAICRGIVEAHGGLIWVDDRSGGGSIFRIALPLPADHPNEAGAPGTYDYDSGRPAGAGH